MSAVADQDIGPGELTISRPAKAKVAAFVARKCGLQLLLDFSRDGFCGPGTIGLDNWLKSQTGSLYCLHDIDRAHRSVGEDDCQALTDKVVSLAEESWREDPRRQRTTMSSSDAIHYPTVLRGWPNVT